MSNSRLNNPFSSPDTLSNTSPSTLSEGISVSPPIETSVSPPIETSVSPPVKRTLPLGLDMRANYSVGYYKNILHTFQRLSESDRKYSAKPSCINFNEHFKYKMDTNEMIPVYIELIKCIIANKIYKGFFYIPLSDSDIKEDIYNDDIEANTRKALLEQISVQPYYIAVQNFIEQIYLKNIDYIEYYLLMIEANLYTTQPDIHALIPFQTRIQIVNYIFDRTDDVPIFFNSVTREHINTLYDTLANFRKGPMPSTSATYFISSLLQINHSNGPESYIVEYIKNKIIDYSEYRDNYNHLVNQIRTTMRTRCKFRPIRELEFREESKYEYFVKDLLTKKLEDKFIVKTLYDATDGVIKDIEVAQVLLECYKTGQIINLNEEFYRPCCS